MKLWLRSGIKRTAYPFVFHGTQVRRRGLDSPCARELPFCKFHQEWPRQTKPKKGQFMNFSQRDSGTKAQCELCLFSQGKTPEFTNKWAKFMNFSFWHFFGLPGRLLIPRRERGVIGREAKAPTPILSAILGTWSVYYGPIFRSQKKTHKAKKSHEQHQRIF